jgi:hypothetical protein
MDELVVDDSVRALDPGLREAVSQIWLGRAQGESSTSVVFERVAQAARELGATAEVVRLTARAARDEVRHARLCHRLAELYAGRGLVQAQAAPIDSVRFGDAPPDLNRHLLLIYQSCINEGIAAAYLQENLRLVRASAARTVIHQLLRDDLMHARIGWAHLASPVISADLRRHVGAALPTLVGVAREAWLTAGVSADLDCPEHGCLGRLRHPDIVNAAIEEMILPGFAYLGIAFDAEACQVRNSPCVPRCVAAVREGRETCEVPTDERVGELPDV